MADQTQDTVSDDPGPYMGGYMPRASMLRRRGMLNSQINSLGKDDPYGEFKRKNIQTELDRINSNLGNVLG